MKAKSINNQIGRLVLLLGIVLGALLAGCASHPSDGLGSADRSRLDVLTDFTLDLSKRDFRSALNRLAPDDRSMMVDSKGDVLPEFRERLLALRLTTLLHDPEIRIAHDRISGIGGVLPKWGTAGNSEAPAPEAEDTNRTVLAEPSPPHEADPDSGLHDAAERFFKSVERKRWLNALDMVDAQERQVFVKNNGKLRPGTRRRLAAMDTASWQALSYQGGKLAGVVLLIPDRPDERPEAAN